MNLQKAVQLYPLARCNLKKSLLRALQNEDAGIAHVIAENWPTPGSDGIMQTIAAGDAAFKAAKILVDHPLPCWDGEINTDNINQVRKAAEAIEYSDNVNHDYQIRSSCCEAVRCAELIFKLTRFTSEG